MAHLLHKKDLDDNCEWGQYQEYMQQSYFEFSV